MKEIKFEDNIVQIELLLRKVCFNIKQKGREILEDYSITPPQFDALQLLVNEGDMTVSELSSKLFLAPSTITDLVDRMEKSEHVERTRDFKDRRIVKIKPMEKGRVVINDVIERRQEYIKDLLKDLSDEDTNCFLNYLNILENKHCSK